jgi:hypothetical protein
MALAKKRQAVATFRGGGFKLAPLDTPDAPDPATADFIDVAHLEKADLMREIGFEKVYDERGKKINAVELDDDCIVDCIFLQSDKDFVDFINVTVKDKYYTLYRYNGIVNGLHQEILFPCVKIRPGVSLSDRVKKPPVIIEALVCEADVVLPDTKLPSSAYASTITIPAGEPYAVVETAPA